MQKEGIWLSKNKASVVQRIMIMITINLQTRKGQYMNRNLSDFKSQMALNIRKASQLHFPDMTLVNVQILKTTLHYQADDARVSHPKNFGNGWMMHFKNLSTLFADKLSS